MNIQPVTDYEFGLRGARRNPEWERMADGGTYRVDLTDGTRYESVRAGVIRAAARKGWKVRADRFPDSMVIQAFDPNANGSP